MAGLRMAMPLLALDQGHGAASVGVLVALFGIGQIAVSLPAGRMVDRHGLKRPMVVALLAGASAPLLAVAWPTFPVLCLAAVLEGAGIAIAVIATQRHAGRLAETPAEVRRIFSWVSFTSAASNFAGPLLAGFVIDALGFRWAMLALAVGPLASWLFVRGASEARPPPSGEAALSAALDLWRDPLVRRVLLMNWFVSSTWEMHNVMVPLLGHARGLPASAVGTILGFFALAAALVRLVVPWLAARMAEWRLVAGSFALAAVLLAIYPLVQSAATMTLLSMLIGLAVGGVQPLVLGLLHHAAPAQRLGQAASLRLMLVNASAVGMPLLSGFGGGLIGVGGVFWATGLSLLAGIRMAAGLGRMLACRDHGRLGRS